MELNSDIQSIINRQYENGGPYWSREDGNIRAPSGSNTIETLFVLGEIGIRWQDLPVIKEAVEYVFKYQNKDGSFRYHTLASKLPCLTALILAALGRLKVDNQRLENAYNWLLEIQWSDGGWRCMTVKVGKSPITDASNPGTTLFVLDAFRFRNNSPDVIDKLNKGADFLLQHWEVRQPVGPCAFGIGTRFMKIEYPFMRYNLFYYVYVLSFYDYAKKDLRFKEAYTILKNKINDGKIIPENPHKTWQSFDFACKNQPSELATMRWNEIEKNIYR